MDVVRAVSKIAIGAAAGVLLLANPTFAANLITNGTFDSGTAGWSFASADGTTWASSEGNPGGALILNNSPGPVPQASQSIAGLVVGTEYQISLDAKSHYNCCNNPTTPGAGVGIDGKQFDFLIVNRQPWTHYEFAFTYAGGSNLFVLSAQRNGTDSDGEFDNVNLTALSAPIPEPESYAMLLAGLGLLGFMARRRKR